jgi:hypothetical protein
MLRRRDRKAAVGGSESGARRGRLKDRTGPVGRVGNVGSAVGGTRFGSVLIAEELDERKRVAGAASGAGCDAFSEAGARGCRTGGGYGKEQRSKKCQLHGG